MTAFARRRGSNSGSFSQPQTRLGANEFGFLLGLPRRPVAFEAEFQRQQQFEREGVKLGVNRCDALFVKGRHWIGTNKGKQSDQPCLYPMRLSPEKRYGSVAAGYVQTRPTYPDGLFEWLAGLAPARELALDVACGNGQATVGAAAWFKKVVATDISSDMLERAPCLPNVEYRVPPFAHLFRKRKSLA